jgi:hypothetical protein
MNEVKVSESESEHDRKVREYWARRFSIYDIGSIDFKNDDNTRLPYKPTAVLAKASIFARDRNKYRLTYIRC